MQQDPVAYPRRYARPADQEVAAFLASALAYGRADVARQTVERLLALGGNDLAGYVLDFHPRRELPRFHGLRHRLSTGRDLACLVFFLRQALERYGTLGRLFLEGYRESHENTLPALARFVEFFRRLDPAPVYGRRMYPQGLLHFFPDPRKGSACKRLHLFLRWMVRSGDGVDLGLWPEIPARKLLVPLDTHVARLSRHLGLVSHRTPSGRTACALTQAFSRLEPEDPLKYDFALCHYGMSGACPPTPEPGHCRRCLLRLACRAAAGSA